MIATFYHGRISALVLLALGLCVSPARAEIIPASRKIAWQPGVNVGVPGGIPIRPQGKNAVTDYGADPTGVTDSKAAIASAMNNTPSGTAAYVPAGIYKIVGTLSPKGGVSLRGAGMGKTILKFQGDASNGSIVNSGDWPNPGPTINITAGGTKGSTSVTVSAITGAAANKLITISAVNPAFVFSNGGTYGSGPTDSGHDATRLLASTHYVTSIAGTTINFTPSLPFDMVNTPRITLWTSITQDFGIEDLTFDQTSSSATAAVYLSGGYKCWIKNVEVKKTKSRQFWFKRLLNSEIRGCYTHDTVGTGPNHEGIDLVQNASFNLIENNICVAGGKPAIMLGDWGGGCHGNVIAYNYIASNPNNAGALEASISAHGPHNVMNLFEGNVGQSVKADGYYGSYSHNTFLRNYFSGSYPSTTDWPLAVQMCKWSYYVNFVGNVLGKAGLGQVYTTTTNGYGPAVKVIWQLGFPNTGNSSYSGTYSGTPTTPGNAAGANKFDEAVATSMIRHGNFDYATNDTTWETGNSNVTDYTDHVIPNSYLYNSKPSWWPATLAWPPIGSDRTPRIGEIPAQIKYRMIPVNMGVLP